MEAFILPSAIYMKLMNKESPLYYHAMILFGMGIVIMIAVVTMTVITLQ